MDKEDMDWKENKTLPDPSSSIKNESLQGPSKPEDTPEKGIPAGLEALFNACRQLYPEQPNPLQVTALVKYWLGGPDPLDYISMYEVPGDASKNIPPHWHYVSFGLSDIHGDGRVHEFTGPEKESGFGFELTMRLKKEATDKGPPTWPAAVMQGLAKYVFQSESVLCVGDHVSLHAPLDGSESRVQHILMTEDPGLGSVKTPNGRMQFVQVVGITGEELRAVQHWTGAGVLAIMKRKLVTGGPWLVTDMRRGECIYELDPGVADEVETGIETQGSNLSGVSAKVAWTSDQSPVIIDGVCLPVDRLQISPNDIQIDMSATAGSSGPAELVNASILRTLHITINLESGALLPLALRGRLKHGRHFTFRSVSGPSAITLVPLGVSGAFVSAEDPYGLRGTWLQVLIPPDLLDKMSADLSALADPDEVKVPVTFQWPSHKLQITVIREDS